MLVEFDENNFPFTEDDIIKTEEEKRAIILNIIKQCWELQDAQWLPQGVLRQYVAPKCFAFLICLSNQHTKYKNSQ